MADPQPTPPARLPDWEAFYRDYRKPGYVAGFEITTKLGGGAFGLVFRARKESIGKDYAIKFLQVEDSEVREAVLRELEQVKYFAQVDHPNLVQIEDRGEVDGIPYLVMQFAGSDTLRDRLPNGQPPSPELREELLRYFLQACRGVAALHERSLVHFDLKPANVFLKGPVARVGDYGLSKLVTHSRGSLTMGRGTPYYMAPEMLQRRGDHRSDIYSLGVMLYEMLCGRLPFTGESEWEVLRKHEKEQPELPSHLAPVERAVLQRCLQKNPDARFQSVHDVITALGAPAGVAAAAWDDVRSGVGFDGPPASPATPPPLPPPPGRPGSAAEPEDAGQDPYAGFRDASREAYKHARKIAGEAFANAKEVSRKASEKAREIVAETMKKTREQHRQVWGRRREERRQQRAARRAAKVAARQARREQRSPLAGLARVLMVAAVPVGLGVVMLMLYGTVGSVTMGPSSGVSVAVASAPNPVDSWVTYPGVVSDRERFLFDQWSVPRPLVDQVAVVEPQWVSTYERSQDKAARELDAHWQRLRTKVPYKSSSRARTYTLPQFHLFQFDPGHDGDIRQLLAAPDYDEAIARRLAKAAPQSLAIAATELDRIQYLVAEDVERARRLHRLLTEATGFDAIEFAASRQMSLPQVRRANAQLGAVWQWFLHEVAITDRTWQVYRRLHRR